MAPSKPPASLARLKRFLQDAVFEIAEEIQKTVEEKGNPRHFKAAGIVRYGSQLSLISELLMVVNTRLRPLSQKERDELIARVKRGYSIDLEGRTFMSHREIGNHKINELLEILSSQ